MKSSLIWNVADFDEAFAAQEDSFYHAVAGTDEVGRGPLAGDVVAAAVILSPGKVVAGLNDSKKLTEKQRSLYAEQIKMESLAWAIGRASVAEIDEINILQASLLAMSRAVNGLSNKPVHVFVDGNKIPRWEYSSTPVVKGDSKLACIAAASVLAKVCRDEEMCAFEQQYPGYGLAQHKGYPTKQHMQALKDLGPTPIHRRSFKPVSELLQSF